MIARPHACSAGSRPVPALRPLERLALLALGAALAGAGCASTSDISGVWRSEALAAGPLAGALGAEVTLELTIGHFGPDISGMMRFYRDLDFEDPLDPTAPHFACSCMLLHKGRWSESRQRLAFEGQGCLPGTSDQAAALSAALLTVAGDELAGTWQRTDGTIKQSVRVRRVSGLDDAELSCNRFADPALGNVANGL